MLKKYIYTSSLLLICISCLTMGYCQDNIISFQPGATRLPLLPKKGLLSIETDPQDYPVVHIAARDLRNDLYQVAGVTAALNTGSGNTGTRIVAGTLGHSAVVDRWVKRYGLNISGIKGQWEKFLIQVPDTASTGGVLTILIAGSDKRATAYGIYELSRQMGVSPWYWWADVPIAKHSALYVQPGAHYFGPPSVQYRGIFINDEDFGLNPWSSQNYEPETVTAFPLQPPFKGALGPRTYARVFELLLRLRANTIWPAMHEVTMPFYLVRGNREMAADYGIFLGSAHSEPLARNSATEWDLTGSGPYNYLTNKKNIQAYWEDRLKTLKPGENIFTIGMRGKHDGPMQGVHSTAANKKALEEVIPDQRDLLRKYIDPDISRIPQMLIPYKELLDVYRAGLSVPQDVTLMWCDDNYGYLTHFPDSTEQLRPGGNGVYYHASYWGRPHDYLWLGTTSPYLMQQQLGLAYEKRSRKIWILNVGDIKPAEYQIQLFMDMAWNIDRLQALGVSGHLHQWLRGIFGEGPAGNLLPLMQEHYRLAFIRKPEFMGNTRTEEADPRYKIVSDLPWTEAQIRDRLSSYQEIARQAGDIAKDLADSKQNSYFELVQYPVQAAAAMNRKMLLGQRARHAVPATADDLWSRSDTAYNLIVTLTQRYNKLAGGKWKGVMSFQPRGLPVFQKLSRQPSDQKAIIRKEPLFVLNAADYQQRTGTPKPLKGLGYQGKAMVLNKANAISFELEGLPEDSVLVEVRFIPTHPVSGDALRVQVSLDNQKSAPVSYATRGRSEEWKQNVLRNQAIRKFRFLPNSSKHHIFEIKALDDGVIIDQLLIF